MAIELISKVKPKNNGTFKLMDAVDMEMADGKNCQETIDGILQQLEDLSYKIISIDSFSASTSVAEMGSTVRGLVLNWTLSKTPISQELDGVDLADNDLRTYTETTDITTDKTYTLKVADSKNTVTKQVKISFQNKKYVGVSNSTTYDDTFITSLSGSFTTSRQGNFTVDCGADENIFFCIPSRFGVPSFSVGGFSGGFVLEATIEFTNPSGFAEEYNIYKSENKNLGSTTVVVG
jgi:hypothetical protein